jgi:hypothetical protein
MIRATTEIGPELSEQLAFSTDEAGLSVKALAYFVSSSLQTLEANWNTEGLDALFNSPGEAMREIEHISQFVSLNRGLAEKVSRSIDTPEEPRELSPPELQALGSALFRFGNSGLSHARKALARDYANTDPRVQQGAEVAIRQTADNAFELFKELEPIAQSKKNMTWMVWRDRPSAAGLR